MQKTIYFGGPILTMEPGPAPQAVLVDGGRIEAVGDLPALEARAPGAQRWDLAGRALLPAFLDPHSHITALASTLGLAQLGAAGSWAEIGAILRAFRDGKGTAPGAWVVGFGYDHNVLDERAHPDRRALDAALPDNPVMITHASGHMGVLNTAALAAMGITADTPDPPGGKIGREADGLTPSGYLEETAFTSLAAQMPQAAGEDPYAGIRAAQEVYFSHGIVLAQDGLTDAGRYGLFSGAGLTIDVVGYADEKNAPELAGRPGIGGYKIFLDGSPQGRTAWMLEPYVGGDGAYTGYPIYTDAEVLAFVKTALSQGRQILAHCNGDAAAEQYIRCCRAAQEALGRPIRDIRPVMIHAQLVRRPQLAEMARLGIIPSFFAAHVWYWGDVHVENFGAQRASSISPLRTAAELGLPFTLHQDTPVIQPDMIESVWCAANRITRGGRVLGPEEKISAYDALRAVTIHAAYQYFMERERGSIAPGKRADFAILSADPTAVAPEKIREIRVLETVKDGKTVYGQAV